jgi:hypothetical protein
VLWTRSGLLVPHLFTVAGVWVSMWMRRPSASTAVQRNECHSLSPRAARRRPRHIAHPAASVASVTLPVESADPRMGRPGTVECMDGLVLVTCGVEDLDVSVRINGRRGLGWCEWPQRALGRRGRSGSRRPARTLPANDGGPRPSGPCPAPATRHHEVPLALLGGPSWPTYGDITWRRTAHRGLANRVRTGHRHERGGSSPCSRRRAD